MDTTVTVEGVTEVGAATVAITFTTPEGFEAEPGQFVRLTADVEGESVSRFYTISSPNVTDTFETTVGVDGGDEEGPDFAGYLAALQPGETVEVSGPFGDEYYEHESRAVVLADGPGIGPAVAVADRAIAAGNEAAVIYQSAAPAHTERLDALRAAGASVTVTDGGIEQAVSAAITGREGERAFVYGFDAFVTEARETLAAAGVSLDDAKIENFG